MKRLAPVAALAMLLGIAAFAVACGGSAPPSEPAAAPAAEQPETPATPPEAPAPAEPVISAPTSDDSYAGTMKMVATSAEALQAAVSGGVAADAGREARRLEKIFAGVETFWAGRNTADAVGFAKAAAGAAQTIAAAADANDMAKAGAAVKTLNAQCASCHKAHRQQDGDYYSIK